MTQVFPQKNETIAYVAQATQQLEQCKALLFLMVYPATFLY